MGARLCRSFVERGSSIPKRTDYSIDASTASEPSSQAEYAPPQSAEIANDPKIQSCATSCNPCSEYPLSTSHRSYNRCTTACGSSCRPHIPRVSSGCLTPIEEEPPPRSEFGGRMRGSHSIARQGRSRTRSSDSLESSVSSFGSMKNYQRFVKSRT